MRNSNKYQICNMDLDVNELKNSKKSIHSISTITAYIFVSILFGLFGCVYLIDGILPTALKIEDEKNFPSRFIAERAREHLKALTDIGPRIAGTVENEVHAVEFLKSAINKIIKMANRNHKIEVDIQTVSGSFFLDYKPDGIINVYSHVQNVLVKLHATSFSNYSLLVNAHFDSVATSPGGSDDGINCAIMLEILQKLSSSSHSLKHNIIFLFNGAEETPLQAAHGFITQHKWATNIKVVVNLEAAGVGGKEILFQSGPKSPWLLKYYSKVPRPNGQAAGEELFQTGLIPSDTDFRVFRDFGKIVGMDFAFNRNGYRYHTKYDQFEAIPNGSYQHAGDNALALINNLANASELSVTEEITPEDVVFFDFMTLFMIHYSGNLIIVINVTVGVFSIAVAAKTFYTFGCGRSSFTYCFVYCLALLLSIILVTLYVSLQALFVDAINYSMSWYHNTWIIFGLYVLPVMIINLGTICIFNYKNTRQNKWCISVQSQVQLHLFRSIWSLLLIIGTSFGIRSVYAIMILVLFQSVSFLIIEIFRLQYTVKKWLIIYIFGTIIPTIFLMRSSLEIVSVIVPICGRISSDKNPEIIVGLLTMLLTIVISSSYAPLVTLLYKPKMLIALIAACYFLFVIIIFTPLGFPYSANENYPTPQRFWIYHMSRNFRDSNHDVYKNNSGFFLLNLDRNSPKSVRNYVKEFENASESTDCDAIFCGYPIASSRIVPVLSQSTWIPAGEPIVPDPVELKFNSRHASNNGTRFNFTLSGTNYMNIYVAAKSNCSITNISLVQELPRPIVWKGRSVYLIMYVSAKDKVPLTFSIQLDSVGDEKMLDIAIAGRFLYDKENVKTHEYVKFLNQFPDWANIYSWIGVYESWTY